MFTLWYTVLTYKEYRDALWDKLSSKKPPTPKETAIVCPLTPKKNEPSKIPIVEPSKTPRTPSPQVPLTPPSPQPPQKPPSPQIPPSPPITPKPQTPESPNPPKKVNTPPKSPRVPSPHPMVLDTTDNLSMSEESSEAEEDEEENSVLATPHRKPFAKTVNDFIDGEKNS